MSNFILPILISLSIFFINSNNLPSQESRLKLYKSLELKIDYNRTYNLNIKQLVKKFKLYPTQRLELFKSADLPSKKRGICKIKVELYEMTVPVMNAQEIAEEITNTGAQLADIIITCELMKKMVLPGNKLGFKKKDLLGSEFILIGFGSHFKRLNDEESKYHLTLTPTLFRIKNTTFLELEEYEPSMYDGGPYFVAFRKIE